MGQIIHSAKQLIGEKEKTRMTWTTWIETEPDDTTDEGARLLYNSIRDPITGLLSDDTVRLTSLTPQVAGLLHNLRHAIHANATGLSVREQEVAALIVCAYNG
jgi:hypothetical protein